MMSLIEIRKSFLVSIWFMFLTFPIMVIRVNTVENIVEWRWNNMLAVGVGSFLLSFVWRYLIRRKEQGARRRQEGAGPRMSIFQRIGEDRRVFLPAWPWRPWRWWYSPFWSPCTRSTS